jgi:hypothetical protein
MISIIGLMLLTGDTFMLTSLGSLAEGSVDW